MKLGNIESERVNKAFLLDEESKTTAQLNNIIKSDSCLTQYKLKDNEQVFLYF